MTLQQYKASIQTYRKSVLWSSAGFMAAIFASAAPMVYVGERSRATGFDARFWLIIGVCFPIFAFILFYSAARYPQRRMRALGLLCPACQEMLVGFSSQVVVATGRCGHCGAQVLESR